MICNLCPRKCGAVRTAHSGNGFCKNGRTASCCKSCSALWRRTVHKRHKGSGTVFFSGCTM